MIKYSLFVGANICLYGYEDVTVLLNFCYENKRGVKQ